MWELPKSVLSFSWAMSLFGLQQMANLFAPSKAAKAFEDVTQATEAELSGVLRTAFRAGNTLQRDVVDLTFGAFTGQVLDPSRWTGRASDVTQRSATTPQQSGQPTSHVGWSPSSPGAQTATNAGRPAPRPVRPDIQGTSAHAPHAAAGWGPIPSSEPGLPAGVQPIA